MIESLLNFIQTYLMPLGGLGVFVASVLEEVFAPIPSAVVTFTSGFLLVSGPINLGSLTTLLLKVAVPASLGVTLGSLFVYAIAFFAGKPVLDKWGKWLGLSWNDILNLQQKFSKTSFDELSLFAVRAVPIVPSIVISAFCGLVRFPLRSYILYSIAGLLIRTAILGFVGWQVGKLYYRYAEAVALFENFIFGAIIVFILLFIFWKIFRSRRVL